MISKFSIFTYLYLVDISLEPEFSTICGYTDKDLGTVFKEEVKNFDRDKIRTWYNGYSWLGEEKVYNPRGILKLFFNKEFKSWCPEDGTPHYLFYYLMKKRALPLQLENSLILDDDLIKFSMDSGKIEALYFQSGFLTIQEELYKVDDIYYRLDYPNLEARKSFHHGLMAYITQGQIDDEYKSELTEYLKHNYFKKFCEYLHNKLCGVSCYWNMMPNERFFFNYESCYSLFLYASLHSPNLQMIPEQPSKAGRSDLTVLYDKQVFIFELKMAKSAKGLKKALDSAMDQIKKRGYGESYKDSEQPIHLIALAFSKEERNAIGWRHEMLS
ncbi:MAG: PD-(D/E)XK nuclease domain-containing protein [Proteobacteria bacterium]|nr:PD-(D/E)XK nuclease domain-containing protein [Pseudomonadota bacterium]